MTVLRHANREWESRPADERFGSLKDMHKAAVKFRDTSTVQEIAYSDLAVRPVGDHVAISLGGKETARLNHWSFGQLAKSVGAPAGFLRQLSADTASRAIVEQLAKRSGAKLADDASEKDGRAMVLLNKNGKDTSVRAFTSTDYSRIWNADVTQKLMALEAEGPWQPAPAAFDGSRGLYLGDRDMFAFMVDNERRIFEKDQNGGLSRGFFAWNSEVGSRSIGVATFLYEYVCGNHRVWGVQDVKEMRIAHIFTDGAKAWSKIAVELAKYAESSAGDDEARIEAMRRYEIGATKEEVLDAVFKFITRERAVEALELAEKREDWYGNPRSAWGFAGALTEIARDLPNADERSDLERSATKVMALSA